MWQPWEHLFVLVFAAAWPFYEARVGYPRFLREVAAGRPGARLAAYRQALAFQWTLAPAAVLLWWLARRPLPELGLGFSLDARLAIGAAILAAAFFFLEAQRRSVAAHPELHDQVRSQLAYAEPLLPHRADEKRLFLALSVTAGVCEEILFRGYLTAYLSSWLGTWGGWLAASAAFGAAHLYLGPVAAVRAGAVGVVAGGLYLLTGSLWTPILLHAAIDVNAGQIAYLVYGERGPAERAA